MPIIITSGGPWFTPVDPAWEFDPLSEDAANINLPLEADYGVVAFAAPMPQPDVLYASSVDTEGENPASVRFRNRQITLTVDVANVTAMHALELKIGKLIREKGTFQYTTHSGEPIVFDVLTVDSYEFPFDDTWVLEGIYRTTLT